MKNSSTRKVPFYSRSTRNVLLDLPNFSRSINEPSYGSTIIVCFSIFDFLLYLIMNILSF